MKYLKDNWPHLLATVVCSLLSTAFALGLASATVGNRVSNIEHRLDEANLASVPETRWEVQQNIATIAALRADSRQTEASVAQINTRLGVIDAKLDAIAEAVKRK
jgi:hypothetical protein